MKSLQTPQKQTAAAVVTAVSRNTIMQSEVSAHPYPSIQDHPNDDELDEYLMNRLPAHIGELIRSHLNRCEVCCERVMNAADFAAMMRSAAGVSILCPKWPAAWTTREADAVERVDQSA